MFVPQHIIDILKKREAREALTEAELLQLRKWYQEGTSSNNLFGEKDWEATVLEYVAFVTNRSQKDQALKRFMSAADFIDQTLPPRSLYVYADESVEDDSLSITSVRAVRPIQFIRKWGWAAASIILVLGIGAYLWTTHSNNKETSAIAQTMEDTAPGSDGAILTLADGRQVVLDSLNNGVIASQNGSDVVLHNGLLAYDLTGASTEAVVYNTITTPNGRQFAATLPDGTRVWLNAGSSIQYPTVFNAPERRVVVTGEVYMEVAADKSKPFLVNIDQRAQVEVLGTTFNVNAYQNEPSITTTLIAGAVRVKSEGKVSEVLAPGQQAAIGKTILVSNANIEGVTAWRNDIFYFNQVSFTEVMRQIERWYDVEVVYEQGIPNIQLFGSVRRDLSLEGLIRGLKAMGVQLRLEPGKKLVVAPS